MLSEGSDGSVRPDVDVVVVVPDVTVPEVTVPLIVLVKVEVKEPEVKVDVVTVVVEGMTVSVNPAMAFG
jgi:hypothetical protein